MTQRHDASKHGLKPARLLLKPKKVGKGQQRESDRTMTKRSVAVSLEESSASIEAPLLDVSPTGFRLGLAEPVAAGSGIVIEVTPGERLKGTVRRATKQDGRPIVGGVWDTRLSFEDVWRIRAFAPGKQISAEAPE